MSRSRAFACALLALAAAAGTLVLTAFVSPDAAARPAAGALSELLPDLDPIAPAGLIAQVADKGHGRRILLGFISAASNEGAGPLIIQGHREGLNSPGMVADQVILLKNGQTRTRPGVGELRYVLDPTHQHWHLLKFMVYELRRASNFTLIAPDEKTGFCLGDRYDSDPDTLLPGEPINRVYNSNCGPKQTDLLGIMEGISVGWGDVYEAWRDGQYLDLTGVPAGKYLVVHRVNADHAIKESSYANNASSVLLSLAWPRGMTNLPRIDILASCSQKERCKAKRVGATS